MSEFKEIANDVKESVFSDSAIAALGAVVGMGAGEYLQAKQNINPLYLIGGGILVVIATFLAGLKGKFKALSLGFGIGLGIDGAYKWASAQGYFKAIGL